jgi:hypothetical protein
VGNLFGPPSFGSRERDDYISILRQRMNNPFAPTAKVVGGVAGVAYEWTVPSGAIGPLAAQSLLGASVAGPAQNIALGGGLNIASGELRIGPGPAVATLNLGQTLNLGVLDELIVASDNAGRWILCIATNGSVNSLGNWQFSNIDPAPAGENALYWNGTQHVLKSGGASRVFYFPLRVRKS